MYLIKHTRDKEDQEMEWGTISAMSRIDKGLTCVICTIFFHITKNEIWILVEKGKIMSRKFTEEKLQMAKSMWRDAVIH